ARALERNASTIKNIRLWDHRPLLRTFAQLQEIRTYYRFVDVDNDRYTVNGEYRQLMLSPRELSYQNLQTRAGSWINEHLTFTHGYGVVVGPVNRITPEGLPELWVKDIPPQSEGFTRVTRPEIYFGEISNDYVLVRTRSQELDYPAGDQNVYATYAGRGGVPLVSWLRKLIFAARFGEIKLLLSNDLTPESRLMMYRTVGERVRTIAPFFQYDRDPYIVVTDDGRLQWMLDGYTTTDRYPYSDPVRGLGNYIRNSVKAVIDAYHGTRSDLTPESRLMMYRTVGERVRTIAPFFQYDRDPYIVVTDDGRLQWMLDGYTTTDRYPYSDPVRGLGNYIRNSVKAVIDAYHGTVTFYIADATDPIVRAYARAFPGLLKPLSEMPADLQRHIRYPEDFFTIQARKYATYHMLDPQVFYNKEDLWAVPRRTVEGRERDTEPYYTIMRLPGEAREEFILLTLFNP